MTKSNEKTTEILSKLEQGVKELFESEKYQNYLNTMSKFHNYSYRNSLLIMMQRPDASHVAGFNAWKKDFKRHVKKGEKGISILAYAPFKIKQEIDGEEREVVIPSFKPVTVFDVAQTEGQELPNIANTLEGDVKDYGMFLNALTAISPVPMSFENIDCGANGYYSPSEQKIVIQENLSEQQTIKTAIHELAHATLHNPELFEDSEDLPDRKTKEVQAESVAYAICQHFGIDSSDYSFGYIAGWSSTKELDELKRSLEIIHDATNTLINQLTEKLRG